MLSKKCPACGQETLTHDETYISCTNCKVYSKKINLFLRPFAWALNRYWWWRLPLLIWFAVMLVQNWHDPWFAVYRTSNPFSAFDLGIHELGHIIFSPFGTLMHIAGGCLFQCLFPIMGIAAFIQIRWYFASVMCLPWLGLNLFDVASYAADARVRLLPLSTGIAGIGEQGSDQAYDQAHDWYQLLSRTHHLTWDLTIAHYLRIAATSVTILGLVIGALLIATMMYGSVNRRLNNQNV